MFRRNKHEYNQGEISLMFGKKKECQFNVWKARNISTTSAEMFSAWPTRPLNYVSLGLYRYLIRNGVCTVRRCSELVEEDIISVKKSKPLT
jgi:hypothetical protein